MVFPRVLVISHDPFNRIDATGITLSNLFEGWDKNCISQVYLSEVLPETDVCENFYKLSPKINFFDYYVRKFVSFIHPKRRNNITSTAIPLTAKNQTIRNVLHMQMRAIADFSPVFLPKDLFNWINTFNPDLIYCSLGDGKRLEIANIIGKKIRRPIVPHFMDDWPNTLYIQNELFGLGRNFLRKKFKSMLDKSNGGMCISELMVQEYENRYQKPFVAFSNSVDDSFFSQPVFPNERNFSLMYIGGLHLNRWKSLLDISKAVEKINEKGRRIVLKIFCPLNDIELYAKYFVELTSTKFEGSIKSSEVFDKLKEASVVVHVESFEDNFAKYTRLSLSTKIPQYMAAGKPILGYGPKTLASMQNILAAKGGTVVSDKKSEVLEKEIVALLEDQNLFRTFSENSYFYAQKYYSKSSNLKRLLSTLKTYARKSVETGY